MDKVIEFVSCNLCHSTGSIKLPAFYNYKDHHLDLVKCPQCGLVYVNPRPTVKNLVELYSDSYFERDWNCGCTGDTYIEAREKLIAMYKADPLTRLKRLGEVGRILDIGCAGGHFLAAAKEEGWETWGLEINIQMANFAKDQGHQVLTQNLPDCQFPPEFFTAIQMGDVIEHLPDPLGTVREAVRILKLNGILAVHAPVSYAKLELDAAPNPIEVPPYHIYEFKLDTLRKMLEKSGLQVVEFAVDWLPTTPPEKRTEDNIERMSIYARKTVLNGQTS